MLSCNLICCISIVHSLVYKTLGKIGAYSFSLNNFETHPEDKIPSFECIDFLNNCQYIITGGTTVFTFILIIPNIYCIKVGQAKALTVW